MTSRRRFVFRGSKAIGGSAAGCSNASRRAARSFRPREFTGNDRWFDHDASALHRRRNAKRERRRQVVAGAARVKPIIIKPMAAIQPPSARSAMARQAVCAPPSERRNITTSAIVKVITA